MQKLNPKRDKVRANAAYAAKFPRRKRKERKALRRKRVLARELLWLLAHGFECNERLVKEGRCTEEHPLA